jgi:predicted DNA-binding transcriptional regulator
MNQDQVLGWILLLGSVIGVALYFWILFFTPWAWVVIQLSALVAVGGVLGVTAWIGYTLATTPPPMPLEDMDFDFDEDFDLDGEPEETIAETEMVGETSEEGRGELEPGEESESH